MKKVGGGGLLLAGVVVAVLGYLITSPFVEWLLDVLGVILIGGGAIMGIIGLIQMFSGGGERSSEY